MKDERRTKKQLIAELKELRRRVRGLKKSEAEHERAGELTAIFKTVSDNARYGVLISDLAGNIVYINDYFAQVHGYSPDEVIGKNLAVLHSVQQLREVRRIHKQLQDGETSDALEVWHTHKDCSAFPMLMNAVILRDKAGKPVLVANTAIDITKWKRVEEALNESEARFAVFMDHLPAGIYIKDEDSRVLYVNQYMKDFFDADTWTRQISVHHFPKAIAEAMIEDDRRILAEGPLVTIDPVVDREGVEHVLQTHKFPIKREGGPTLIGGIAIDITERKRAEDQLHRSLEKLQSATEAVVQAMAITVEVRDPYTAGHQRRVAQLACAIGKVMGFPDEQIRGLRMAGLIHDIGKIHVPGEILSLPGRLGDLELRLIQRHPQVGYDILKTIEFPWPIAEMIAQHHERVDGSGYPRGLSGEAILLEARILGVADVVEAMSSHRPYRPALGIRKALQEISEHKGTLYDPLVVQACLHVFRKQKFKFEEKSA